MFENATSSAPLFESTRSGSSIVHSSQAVQDAADIAASSPGSTFYPDKKFFEDLMAQMNISDLRELNGAVILLPSPDGFDYGYWAQVDTVSLQFKPDYLEIINAGESRDIFDEGVHPMPNIRIIEAVSEISSKTSAQMAEDAERLFFGDRMRRIIILP